MVRSLPPLNWIRAFEAAARHRSFLHAAQELGVSAGAVSQKIKALEAHLESVLFERHARGVALTDLGRRYRDELGPALDDIAAASRRAASNPTQDRIRIAALPALAERWITPRLPLFHDLQPEIEVELSVAEDVAKLDRASFDVAVHYEVEAQEDLIVEPLFHDEMFPVCHPDLIAEKRLRAPADLLDCRLLYDTRWAEDWSLWFQAAGLPTDGGRRDSGFALYSMAVEAAIEGLGVVMGHDPLVARELESGRLIAPFAQRVAAPRGYAMIVPAWTRRHRAVTAFTDWLRVLAA